MVSTKFTRSWAPYSQSGTQSRLGDLPSPAQRAVTSPRGLGTAVMSALPTRRAYATMQQGVNLVRPVYGHTPTLRCEGTTIHVGRTTATAEARVFGAVDGKLYAHGTTTCAVFALPGAG